MPQKPDRLLNLALHGLVVIFLACAAVLVVVVVVEVLQAGELGPVFQDRQVATSSATAR